MVKNRSSITNSTPPSSALTLLFLSSFLAIMLTFENIRFHHNMYIEWESDLPNPLPAPLSCAYESYTTSVPIKISKYIGRQCKKKNKIIKCLETYFDYFMCVLLNYYFFCADLWNNNIKHR